MSSQTSQFITLDFFKKIIKSTDAQDDDLYTQIIFDSNQKVQTALFPYTDQPIEDGSIYYQRCRSAALYYARSMLSEDQQLFDNATSYLKKYNVELYGDGGTDKTPKAGGLIQEFIALRNTRTKTVLARFDPRDIKVPLTTQNDLFVSQRFG